MHTATWLSVMDLHRRTFNIKIQDLLDREEHEKP
jgi:hypothetical protein